MEELGLSYEVHAIDVRNTQDHKSESFLKINPNGRVPALGNSLPRPTDSFHLTAADPDVLQSITRRVM